MSKVWLSLWYMDGGQEYEWGEGHPGNSGDPVLVDVDDATIARWDAAQAGWQAAPAEMMKLHIGASA